MKNTENHWEQKSLTKQIKKKPVTQVNIPRGVNKRLDFILKQNYCVTF